MTAKDKYIRPRTKRKCKAQGKYAVDIIMRHIGKALSPSISYDELTIHQYLRPLNRKTGSLNYLLCAVFSAHREIMHDRILQSR